MTEPNKSVRVLVRGRVQGVSFRATTAQRAFELGVNGWVRNRSDGGVEAHFEGLEASVDALVMWCEIGSPWSCVEAVSHENAPFEHAADFQIRIKVV
jgi:acylphosphatase